MARKLYSAEEIVNKLREAEVLIAKGTTVAHGGVINVPEDVISQAIDEESQRRFDRCERQ